MYEELINLLRRCGKQKCKDCEYEHVFGCVTKMNEKAADAIEELQKTVNAYQDYLCFLGANYLIEQSEEGEEVLSKMEKTTQQDERLTPKKPKVSIDTWVCPECGRDVEFQAMLGESILFHGQHNFCPNCGQAIDWTEPPEEES